MAKYSTILVTTDFSEQALNGAIEARRLASELGSTVVLLYAVEDRMPPVLDAGIWATAMEQHRSIAQQRLASYAAEHFPDCEHRTVVEPGRPHDVIVEVAERESVDLIVMASHGYGLLGQALLGSTTERVLRHASCPVLVVPTRKRKE